MSNAIDDAFAKMEKQTGETAGSTMMGDIDTEFGKVETYRADLERNVKKSLSESRKSLYALLTIKIMIELIPEWLKSGATLKVML